MKQRGKEVKHNKGDYRDEKRYTNDKGKYVTQGSHASLGVVKWIEYNRTENHKEILNKWFDETFVKVTVYVESLDKLYVIYHLAKEKELPVKLITDNGLTIFNGVKTDTCLAILGERKSG